MLSPFHSIPPPPLLRIAVSYLFPPMFDLELIALDDALDPFQLVSYVHHVLLKVVLFLLKLTDLCLYAIQNHLRLLHLVL